MNPFISVQIVAKENTQFGMKVFRACLNSLLDADYASQVIVVNNGSSNATVDMLYQVLPKFAEKGVEFSVISVPDLKVSTPGTFSTLRNMALFNTSTDADFIHWVDTDEVYIPENLNEFKTFLGTQSNLAVAILDLHHFMVVPHMIQEVYPKDVLYRYNLKLAWGKGVHETLQNRCAGDRVEYHMPYLHFGYCRRQWRTALKWLHYDIIEKGNVDHYTREWGTDWKPEQTPDNIVLDRLNVSRPYGGIYPTSLVHEFGAHLDDDADAWVKYLSELDSEEFWLRWQEQQVKLGSWAATAAWAAQEAGKQNWALV